MNGAPHLIALPQIGTASIEHGGTFAGIHSTPQGDFALFVSGRTSQRDAVKWQDACKAFDGQTIAHHADWYLPSLAELQIARANVADLFDKNWYWSSAQCSRSSAWFVDFEYGNSYTSGKGNEFRARAFRRVPLEHFKASTLEAPPVATAEGGRADFSDAVNSDLLLACQGLLSMAETGVVSLGTIRLARKSVAMATGGAA